MVRKVCEDCKKEFNARRSIIRFCCKGCATGFRLRGKKLSNSHRGKMRDAKIKAIAEGRYVPPSKLPGAAKKISASQMGRPGRKGKDSNFWKGGIMHCMGYIYLKTDIEGLRKKSGYAKRSNVVWFENTGEIIRTPYLLHHIDGDKINDSFNNLKKVTRSEHLKIHQKEKYGRLQKNNVERPD